MSDVPENLAYRRLLRSVMVAVVLPAAVLAGCAQPAPPPPPPPAPVYAPAPPPPAPPPMIRGERG
jgi:hypothetical protein